MNATAVMIVKNEERDLPRCLASLEHVVDNAVIIDTGSSDNTVGIAQHKAPFPTIVETYVGASLQGPDGDWQLWDFSEARNHALEVAEAQVDKRVADPHWLLWMDADDELVTPWPLAGAMARSRAECLAVTIESGGGRWMQHRAWLAGRGVRFEGAVHEYPNLGALVPLELREVVIRHDATDKPGEKSIERNKRILHREWERNPTPRTAFYLARTYHDAAQWADAALWYGRRIDFGEAEGYHDELLFAYLYKGRVERAAGLRVNARMSLVKGRARARLWAEFPMELAYMAADAGDWEKAALWAYQAQACRNVPTLLWREPDKYDVEPRRMLERCAVHGLEV